MAGAYVDGSFVMLGAAVPSPAGEPVQAAAVEGVSFGDGTWLVGTDMVPGNYRATIDSDGFFDNCDYSRLGDLSGTDNGVIEDYHEEGEGEQVLVTIEPTDFAFKTNGCGHWSLIA